jgi:hypothetical protein
MAHYHPTLLASIRLFWPTFVVAIILLTLARDLYLTRQKSAVPVYPVATNGAVWQSLEPHTLYEEKFRLSHTGFTALELPLEATSSPHVNPTTGDVVLSLSGPTLTQPLVATFPLKTLVAQKTIRVEFPQLTNLLPGSTLTLALGTDIDRSIPLGIYTAANPELSRPQFLSVFSVNRHPQATQLLFRPVYTSIETITNINPFAWPYEFAEWWSRLTMFQAVFLLLSLLSLYLLF